MSKKILSLLLVGLLLLGGSTVFAESPILSNAIDESGFGGAEGKTPMTKIMRVRYGHAAANSPTLSSGDVMVWDTNSADGITVTACITDLPATFAGVLVQTCPTSDVGGAFVGPGQSRSWCYIATQGYCLAKVDTSEAATGQALFPQGNTLSSAFATDGSTSEDVGVLLTDTGSDGLMPVYLK